MQKVPFGNLGFDVSRFGIGTMRLPTTKHQDGTLSIDREKAIAMIRRGIDGGVNYVDTAYGYHQGESEVVTGLALQDGYREKTLLTTKLPCWLVKEKADMDKLLDEQLEKLGTPYVDFYLLHSLSLDSYHRMKELDYPEFFERAIKDGRIRHAGFSFHDDKDAFLEIIDDYPWDMAQIQFNYLDDQTQATVDGLLYAGKKGIPVVIMEPLRGGALGFPPEEILEMMQNNHRKYSPAEWAFRYTAHYPQATTILSGVNTMEQLEENLRIFNHITPGNLDKDDLRFIAKVKETYLSRIAIGCTKCNYCMPCPQGVNIPRIFEIYNDSYRFDSPHYLKHQYQFVVRAESEGARCVRCGQCESVCPQQLPIMDTLETIEEMVKQP